MAEKLRISVSSDRVTIFDITRTIRIAIVCSTLTRQLGEVVYPDVEFAFCSASWIVASLAPMCVRVQTKAEFQWQHLANIRQVDCSDL